MGITNLSSGRSVPDDIYVHIEIPQGSSIKYEIDDETGLLMVDRFVHTPMGYPMNYGYIPQTLGLDGDAVDVLVPTPVPLLAGSVIRCHPIGAILMEDEGGRDEKILAIPHTKINPLYDDVKDIEDLPIFLLDQVVYFFEHYKDMEEGKWVKVLGKEGKEDAYRLIQEGVARFTQK